VPGDEVRAVDVAISARAEEGKRQHADGDALGKEPVRKGDFRGEEIEVPALVVSAERLALGAAPAGKATSSADAATTAMAVPMRSETSCHR
jgi:hypothetical protein